jgi:hypothetical protein
MTLARCLLLLPLALPAGRLHAQVPAGAPFDVSPEFFASQARGRVAADPGGGFVVVWAREPQYIPPAADEGSGPLPTGVLGQRYDAAGAPTGAEFEVYPGFSYTPPGVASSASGAFVVTWQGPDGSGYGAFAQRYDASGVPRGSVFRANSFTTGSQGVPVVSSGLAGNSVVTWTSSGQDGSQGGVFGQRYDAAGSPAGPEFRVNAYTTGGQVVYGIASDAAGNFVVVWTDASGLDGSGAGIFAQRYDAGGAPRGANFRVNTFTTGYQTRPAVASDRAGNFVVVWTSGQDGPGTDVFAQRYDAAGTARGSEFRAHTATSADRLFPTVASDAPGGFVINWVARGLPGGSAIQGQRFDASGVQRGSEFLASAVGFVGEPSVASDAAGNFVVVWRKNNWAVTAQRFGGIQASAMTVDTVASGSDGNRVVEPGESVDLRPAWRNVNGATQAFNGGGLAFTGPPASGVSYALQDATGLYGTVGNGATATCSDCYRAAMTFGGTRPSVHWDATFTERLTPDAQGQTMPWPIHVGQSFGDVPKTSPYYRFVETLLHRGVTGGCTSNLYCPASATTREQMAAFVLLAKEGAGYVPVPCSPPNLFADVPESSIFCDVIEELARRGVVGGCGGASYCPTFAVSREQMAVFVLRTLDPKLDPPACGTPMFNDVPATNPFCRWIEELVRRRVVVGCAPGLYCPTAPVTREQMAVFVSATFGLALYGP